MNGHVSESIKVLSVVTDSRKVNKGALFIAERGVVVDGHKYIKSAIQQGAAAILCEEVPTDFELGGMLVIKVQNTRAIVGDIAAAYYDFPSREMTVVGVTGTNGKTTTATLLFQLFKAYGLPVGLLSTVENRILDEVIPSELTTPDPIGLQALLAQMVDRGVSHVFMEVSSHAIHQNRIGGIEFDGGVFTNITHDHLDYHKTFLEYINVKKAFFDGLPAAAFSLVNKDDKRGMVMAQNTKSRIKTMGLSSMADYRAKVIDNTLDGLQLTLNGSELFVRMVGRFNAYNVLTVYSVAMELGLEEQEVLRILSDLKGAEGRFETFRNGTNVGVVDYAHTPDALQNVLETILDIKQEVQDVLTVVGCGGDRDVTKRPEMGQIAAKYSSKVIFTSDNPRSESPSDIIDAMVSGVDIVDQRKCLVIVDREQAIKTACMLATPNDVVLVAGKGHEKYQEINGVKNAFDDKNILIKYLN